MIVTNCGNASDYYGIPGETYCVEKHIRVTDEDCKGCPLLNKNKLRKEERMKWTIEFPDGQKISGKTMASFHKHAKKMGLILIHKRRKARKV